MEELFSFMGPLNGNVGLLTNESVPNLNMIADKMEICSWVYYQVHHRYMEKPDIADILAGILLLFF